MVACCSGAVALLPWCAPLVPSSTKQRVGKGRRGEKEREKSSKAKANAILTRTWIRLANRGGGKASDSFRPRGTDGQLRAAGSGAYSHGRGDAVRTEEFWMGVRPCGLTHSRPRESKQGDTERPAFEASLRDL